MAAKQAQSLPLELMGRIDQLAEAAPRPAPLSKDAQLRLIDSIKHLLQEKDAKIVAHYYVDEAIQALAEATGGKVADSLEMANFGAQTQAQTLVVCGVRFMGETAKMLSPEKTVLMPTMDATCSLDESCPPEAFAAFCAQHPDHTVVVYANTSAEVKALADWVVTSGNALEIVRHLRDQGKKIIWAPDRHLGHWIEQQTGVEMLRWQGHCIVHDEFQSYGLAQMKAQYPQAKVLVHPESPAEVVALADVVGSTRVMIDAVHQMPDQQFIVATDYGIFYKMQQGVPDKELIVAPTSHRGSQQGCVSCAHCPWMAMNGLANLDACLRSGQPTIEIEESVRVKALASIERMLTFSREKGLVKAPEAR